MSTRTTEIITGKEISLAIQKSIGDPATPTYVPVGCGNSVDYSSAKEILTANCFSGRRKVPSGNDPDKTITLQGFYFKYEDEDADDNISADEMEAWHDSSTLLNIKLGFPHTGDPVRSFSGYITEFSFAGETDGLVTYNVNIAIDGPVTKTAQT